MILYVRFDISLPLFGKPAGDVKKDDWFWMLYTDSQDESQLVYQTFSVFSEGLLHSALQNVTVAEGLTRLACNKVSHMLGL